MSWVEKAIEDSKAEILIDVRELDLGIETIPCLPLTMAEYQTLKADPEIRKLTGRDKDELLGVKMAFEMLKKCDDSLNWKTFVQLPIATLTAIAVACAEAMGGADGGRLGE